jgi:hypothetical protein
MFWLNEKTEFCGNAAKRFVVEVKAQLVSVALRAYFIHF